MQRGNVHSVLSERERNKERQTEGNRELWVIRDLERLYHWPEVEATQCSVPQSTGAWELPRSL